MSAPNQLPINDLFQRHLAEIDFWRQVADIVAAELRKAVRHTRIPGKIEARAKTTGSVIGKAYRKPISYTDLAAFADLAGARVLVPFAEDVDVIASELHDHSDFDVIKDEVKIRKPDELKYQARHLDIELHDDFGPPRPPGFNGRAVRCEVQIQTFAQSLWASVSHLVTYKRDLPDEVISRVNRLVVLCEVFDDEAGRARSAALEAVDSVGIIADELQHYFFGITGELHDADSTVALVARLLPSLDAEEQATYPSLLESFVQDYSARLTMLLTDRPEARGLAWLIRPEILLIFERITRRPARLRQVWQNEFPPPELSALESVWGPTHNT